MPEDNNENFSEDTKKTVECDNFRNDINFNIHKMLIVFTIVTIVEN